MFFSNKSKRIGNNKDIVLTGDRPTGKLHLGHYVGSIKKRIELQSKYNQNFYMIADMQALTDNYDNPDKVNSNVLEVAMDNIACGMDPKKTTMFIQSQVPEIAELNFIFLNLVTLSRLKRNPTVKDEIKQKNFDEDIPMGFLTYPVSQAADILAFKANIVPVGEDQLPVIEQANEIILKFNRLYNNSEDFFQKIQPITGDTSRLVGIDGNAKASKSLGNAILLSDSDEEIRSKVKNMYTDPDHIKVEDPGKIEGNVVFIYLDIFANDKEKVSKLKEEYQKGGLGDVKIKEYLTEELIKFMTPIRQKRAKLEKDRDAVLKILEKGSIEAQKRAKETLNDVKNLLKLDYFK